MKMGASELKCSEGGPDEDYYRIEANISFSHFQRKTEAAAGVHLKLHFSNHSKVS
jgi:hypothetical protein